MRVLHILDHSLPHLSGYAIRSHNILRFQRQQDFNPVVLTSAKQGESKALRERFDEIEYNRAAYAVPPGLWQKPYLSEIFLMHCLRQQIRQQIRAVRPQVVHAHSPVLNGWPARLVSRRAALPLIYEVRAFWEDAAVDHGTAREGSLRYRLTRALETILMQRADQVVTLSQTMRAEIMGRGIPAEKVHVVSNAVDASRFTAQPPRGELLEKYELQGKIVIGFIGSFYHYEGLDVLIAAFEKVYAQFPATRLLLVGDGFERKNLETRAQQSPVRSAIILTGAVPPKDVIDYYSLIDVLAYPRHKMRLTELVCPLKPLEAMALNKCVVGSDVGGIREFITPGETGMLFRADDVDHFAKTLCDVVANPGLRQRFGRNGRKAVLQKWDWAQVVKRYWEIYQLAGASLKQRRNRLMD